MATTAYNSKAVRLSEQLRREIAEGQFPAGTVLPVEDELARRYAVTRATVRRALSMLVDRHELVKAPRRGMVVPGWNGRGGPGPRIAQIAFVTLALSGDTDEYARGLSAVAERHEHALSVFSAHANL